MRFILGFVLLSVIVGCSDVNPTVSFLNSPKAPSVQSQEFAQTNLVSGVNTLSTADGYQSKILIHSGSELGRVQTSDQYTLEIRSLSL
ncbi:MAG: hypothetical protein ACKOX6_10515 [Bdellovibrio sp.]